MITQQLLDYIKSQTEKGKSKEEIISALQKAGWQQQDIDQAFNNPNQAVAAVPTPINAEFPKAKQILKESWAIYKNRFKTLVAIILIPTVLYLLFLFLGFGATLIATKVVGSSLQIYKIIGLVLGLIILIFLIYIYVWATVAQLYAIKDQAEGIGWKEAFKRSRAKINPFFTTGLLSGLAILGGFILFIIPGIIFALWFSQSPYIVIEEGLSNSAALKRSKYYVKGRIGQIFGKLFYLGIITLAIYIVLAIIIGIITTLVGIKTQDLSWISNIFSLIWSPLITAYGYQVYKYCRTTRP